MFGRRVRIGSVEWLVQQERDIEPDKITVVSCSRYCSSNPARAQSSGEIHRVNRHRVVDALKRHEVDLVAMAGFGTILAEPIHDAFAGRIVNTHPALLPAFKGWHAVEDALNAGVNVTGWTAHFATLEVDDGPILAQEAVPVLEGDTVETLHERIKEVERRRYPEVLWALLAEERS